MKILTKRNIFLGSILLVSIAIAALVWSVYSDAQQIGNLVGGLPGSIIGKGIGSVTGYNDGYEKGKEDALKNPEIVVDVSGRITNMGKLEVLEADIASISSRIIGPEDNPNFAILFSRDGRAVFTVDLKKAIVDHNNDEKLLTITLPMVEPEYYPDESSFKEIDKYQKKNYTGSTDIGGEQWLNAEKESVKKISEALKSDESLMESAKTNALSQVKTLAETLLPGTEVVVIFEE